MKKKIRMKNYLHTFIIFIYYLHDFIAFISFKAKFSGLNVNNTFHDNSISSKHLQLGVTLYNYILFRLMKLLFRNSLVMLRA